MPWIGASGSCRWNSRRSNRELIEAFTDAADEGTIGVIVLTGEGGNFSSGGDISWEKGFSPAAGRRTARLTGQLSYIMRTCGKPIIAKVRGYCIAAGNELNMLCDLTIAAETARFGQAGTKVGSAPIWWGTQMLPRTVGEKKAREIVYLSRQYDATTAERMGWVNKVVPDDELDVEVEAWCQELLKRSPQALRMSKISLNSESDALWSSIVHGQEMLSLTYGSDEFREGMQSFLEKRRPNFDRYRT